MRADPSHPDPAILSRRVREMIDAGRIHAARPLLGALRRTAPPSPALHDLAARLLLREGRLSEALAELDAGLALDPAAVELLLGRADARMQARDILGAAADAADAVILAPAHAPAKAVLGVILIEMDRPEDALPCLREAARAMPRHGACIRALATALERCDRADEAAETLAAAIAASPADVALRTAAILLATRRRDFPAAAALAEAARQAGVADAQVFGLRGHALSSLGRHDEANAAYAEALKLAPEDPYVRHLVVSAGLLPGASRAPDAYVETVFDGYSARFDQHLIGLHYRAPGLIRAALLAHLPALAAGTPTGPVLDLGCGTGLMGVVLSDLPAGPLTGVDLSEGMLAEARAKGLYRDLVHAELEAFLARDTTAWPVVLAADVLCYFGALDTVLAAIHARQPPGGLLVFTVEELPEPEGWRVGPKGRFAHTEAHLRAAAATAGYALRELRAEPLRTESGADVPGLLAVLERVRHDG